MLADIESAALSAAVESLRPVGPDVRGVTCDVADPASVERAAEAPFSAFGNVHVVCNNAGVGGGSGIDDIQLDTWRWVVDVNLMGVLHGIRSFCRTYAPMRRRSHRQYRVHGRNGERARVQPVCREQVRGGCHVGGIGAAACTLRHRRDIALSGLRAHSHQRKRAQPPGAVRSGARARPRQPGRRSRRSARRTLIVRPCCVGRRGARPRRDPRGELYVFTHPQMRAEAAERFALSRR